MKQAGLLVLAFALGFTVGGYVSVERTLDNLCALKMADLVMICEMRSGE